MRSAPLGTNGIGEPRYAIADIEPGSIVRFGIDDDMTCLVIANHPTTILVGDGEGGTRSKRMRKLVMFGCFCDSTGSYEHDRILTQDFGLSETVTVVLAP
jgi:hypothetical protein